MATSISKIRKVLKRLNPSHRVLLGSSLHDLHAQVCSSRPIGRNLNFLQVDKFMAKYSQGNRISSQTQEEALKIARATQRPGQTKEQTKIIAQGIQKGIDQYKKQHKAKARELDKKLRKASAQPQVEAQIETREVIKHRQSLLPWLLLLFSWLGFGAYAYLMHG
jgi:hypothetical protein